MTKKFFCLVILLLCSAQLKINAQLEFDFSGYALNMPIFQSSNETASSILGMKKDIVLDLTRVRLRPTLYLWSGARLNVEYEIAALYFNSSEDFLMLPKEKTKRQIVDLTWNPVNEKHLSIIHFIDRLYFRQGFTNGSVEIGRQRIAWGTGRIWNPTDLFNPINPAAYYKTEKDGADVVSLKYAFGNFTDLNLVYNPQERLDHSNYGFRFRTNFSGYDASVMGGMFDQRIVAGLDFAGNLGVAGIRGEGILSMQKDDIKNNFVKFILGVDQQFTPELYTMLEYHFNGEGNTNKFNYDFTKLFTGDMLNLNKNYLYTMLSYQITPLLTASLADNQNLNDGSGFLNLLGTYSLEENVTLNFGLQLTYGSSFTEYWYYPSSVYLQGSYYF